MVVVIVVWVVGVTSGVEMVIIVMVETLLCCGMVAGLTVE